MANWYPFLMLTHLVTVALTLALFLLRGWWLLRDSPRLENGWVRIVPHINDTLLLASAVGLMIIVHQYPFVNSWLTGKVLALAAYIFLGSIALKHGSTRRVRIAAFVAALVVFGYIVVTAITRNPMVPLTPINAT
ncbi:SirB2 family protein [Spectribacter hydrogenoxidans]|uniref:SirB2 family protein n=1 Tax=Spectribacter hydrogenoxidans TaxID=3075608 RepID=A0ABU3BYJ7_9GAMM|nr:SirB2 family protein [Salinisphaera sp. W335]MDT0634325.1 SirB2 family protein [Salinisphaera sp. W335]